MLDLAPQGTAEGSVRGMVSRAVQPVVLQRARVVAAGAVAAVQCSVHDGMPQGVATVVQQQVASAVQRGVATGMTSSTASRIA